MCSPSHLLSGDRHDGSQCSLVPVACCSSRPFESRRYVALRIVAQPAHTIASLCPHYFQTKTAIGCNLLKTGQTAVRALISAIFFPSLPSSYCLTHCAGKDPEIGPDSSYPPWVFALADPAPTRQVLFLPTLRASAIHC